MNKDSKLWRLFNELEFEVSRLEEENILLKEKVKQSEVACLCG